MCYRHPEGGRSLVGGGGKDESGGGKWKLPPSPKWGRGWVGVLFVCLVQVVPKKRKILLIKQQPYVKTFYI